MKRNKQPLRPGTWEPGQRGRVLVEHSDAFMEWALTRTLTDAGYDVAHCYGPDAHQECPLVTTGRCVLAEGADVILHDLRQPDGVGAAVRSALYDHLPNTPVIDGIQPVLSRRRAVRSIEQALNTTNGGVTHGTRTA